MTSESIQNLMYVLPILLLSVIVHEVAHGRVALWRGDPTAKELGRLTLNPIPHIDPIGSILVPLLSFWMAGQVFIAWAKPVPINPMNLRNRRLDDVLISIAGPLSNFLMAGFCTLMVVCTIWVMNLLGESAPESVRQFAHFIAQSFVAGITLNIVLAVFNLIPVPPLDGSHVLASLLPPSVGESYRRIGFFGIFLVIYLMRVPAVNAIFSGIVGFCIMPYAIILQTLT